MTRQDFVLIARVLNRCKPEADRINSPLDAWLCWQATRESFANELQDLNPGFDRERFVRYCETGH